MVRIRLKVAIILIILSAGASSAWFVHMQEKSDAKEGRRDFFGSARRYDTTGGEDMRLQW